MIRDVIKVLTLKFFPQPDLGIWIEISRTRFFEVIVPAHHTVLDLMMTVQAVLSNDNFLLDLNSFNLRFLGSFMYRSACLSSFPCISNGGELRVQFVAKGNGGGPIVTSIIL